MYSDSIIQKYIDLIKANCGQIKAFYQGDPVKIPNSNLPCCIIAKSNTTAGFQDSASDEHLVGLSITIITDIRDQLSTDENIAKIAPGIAQLYEIVEGRDANYKLKTNSILNILRTNQLLDVANNLRTDLRNVTRVDYGSTLRSRSPEMWSAEARIDIVVNFIQLR